jgi:hypothetical protein
MVRQCLPIPQKTYNKTKRIKTQEEVEQYFPGFLALIDCTEQQQILRPVDKKKRKMFYSGKKKRHTSVKNQLVVNNRGLIILKIGYKKGRKHNYDVYKRNHPINPKQVITVVDLGYLGIEKDYTNQLSSH